MKENECPFCQSPLSPRAEFCTSCGSQLYKTGLINRLNNSVNLYSIYISLIGALILTLPVFLLLALGLSSAIIPLDVVVVGTVFFLLFIGGFVNALLTTRNQREAIYSGVFLFLVLLFNLALLAALTSFAAVITASMISSILGADSGMDFRDLDSGSTLMDSDNGPGFEDSDTGFSDVSSTNNELDFSPGVSTTPSLQFEGVFGILKLLISLGLILLAAPGGGVVGVRLKELLKK
ncbi:MAG: zinc ribbon domain-containing protein [Euryarchaeota archaeon]|nr:zinc ribbon domain-containing protein [Euryarchaeota archaeon]MBV1729144.1 zinc ribbon domain-containing protein [Methanobacterium sp.]MBU4547830.1 zinc ribbon domain-containing protein [Euryarchaeota archaeon]MBU4608002.1 zinc ribbon domain-containing protein [Euryarchaeota archaeon]MBV1756171.1 zinc ribbon domain-containing protein [Methanobacterium sp.]